MDQYEQDHFRLGSQERNRERELVMSLTLR